MTRAAQDLLQLSLQFYSEFTIRATFSREIWRHGFFGNAEIKVFRREFDNNAGARTPDCPFRSPTPYPFGQPGYTEHVILLAIDNIQQIADAVQKGL